MTDESKYKQWGHFYSIIAEVVLVPGALAGATYFFARGSALRVPLSLLAALLGLAFAFYRILQLTKTKESDKGGK